MRSLNKNLGENGLVVEVHGKVSNVRDWITIRKCLVVKPSIFDFGTKCSGLDRSERDGRT